MQKNDGSTNGIAFVVAAGTRMIGMLPTQLYSRDIGKAGNNVNAAFIECHNVGFGYNYYMTIKLKGLMV